MRSHAVSLPDLKAAMSAVSKLLPQYSRGGNFDFWATEEFLKDFDLLEVLMRLLFQI